MGNVKSMTDDEYYAAQARSLQELIVNDRKRAELLVRECFGGIYLLRKNENNLQQIKQR